MADHLRASLAIEALNMALEERRPAWGSLIHHSDRGVQYACGDYAKLLEAHGIAASMSRVGNPYDNAKAESFMKTLKAEEVDGRLYRDHHEAARCIGTFIEQIYNTPAPALGAWAIDHRPSSRRGIEPPWGWAWATLRELAASRRPRPITGLTRNLIAMTNDQPSVRGFAVSPTGCSPQQNERRKGRKGRKPPFPRK